MNADPTNADGNGGLPGSDSPATIIEPRTSSGSSSAATIIEPRVSAEAAPFLNLIPGASFRTYRLVRPLKVSSAEADLWLIQRQADAVEFVLKLYRYGIHPKPEIQEALRGLRREDVVEIIESGTQDSRSFEIQEFVSNGSLADVIRKGAVPDARVREILAELTDSLSHLHEANVLHRDIKPANILVRSLEPADLILTDFGISSLSDGALHLTNVNRTAAYCAPEALTGVVAKASDWWSVGVIVVELLTGRHPLADLSEQVINFQLVSKGIPIPPEIPVSWQTLLKGLLTRDHEKRWSGQQIRSWLAGDRVPVAADDSSNAVVVAERKPYKFAQKEFTDPRELAAAFAESWAEAVKHSGWSFLGDWVTTELRDGQLGSSLRGLATNYQLSGDQKAAIAIMLLNPELPLIFKGQLVDLNWCQQNALEAVSLAKSPVPQWLKQLNKECCLKPWADQREARRKEITQLGVAVDATVVERLLSTPETAVISAAHEQRMQFAAARDPRLQALLTQPELTFSQAVVLLACDRGLLLSAAQNSHHEKLAQLRDFNVEMDWPLAERLVTADSWEQLRPLWNETRALWQRRQRSRIPLSNPDLAVTLNQSDPVYLDAVAVVANRLGFTNSLGMKFVMVPKLPILFSMWTVRIQDYSVFREATGRLWKPPAFPQSPLHPVVNVSWDDAVAFCQWLTDRERAGGQIGRSDEYRLPYDLEWSQAAGLENEAGELPIHRAGKVPGIFPWGTQWPPPPNVANISAMIRCDPFTQTSPVGSFPPNHNGLYDLGANVSEWCWDFYDPGLQLKTLRGASWFQSTPETLWSSARRGFVPAARSDSVGFRCVLVSRTFVPPIPGQAS